MSEATEHGGGWSGRAKWVVGGLVLVALAVATQWLPVGAWIESIRGWVEGLGVWGPAIYGMIYAVAAVLLLPASALTLAAGAIFGLWVGVVVASVASTTAAAAAFLIARYAARERVEQWVEGKEKAQAVSRAVERGGWKVVAMLRLSPAIPFNLQNYLYGLTPIGFGTCVLTSWIAMLPGTFLYVYLGYVGTEAAAGDAGVWRWLLLGAGLAATVALTVYLTKLAREELRSQTAIGDAENGADAESPGEPAPHEPREPGHDD